MKLEQLANLASLALSSATDLSPRKCLDKLRRHLMYFMCAEDKFELTGTVEDFGGKERRTSDLAKLVFACFEFAEVLKIDLAGALEEKYGGTAEAAAAGATAPGQETASVKKGPDAAQQEQAVSGAAEGKEAAAPAAEGGGAKQPSENGHAPADTSGKGKDELLTMYRKFFGEATELELVENAWKKEIPSNKVLDGKDKGSLYKDYTDAKKRLGGK